MPDTPAFGLPFENPSDLPGISITGGPSGTHDILAQVVEDTLLAQIAALQTQVTSLQAQVNDLQLPETESVQNTTGISNFNSPAYAAPSPSIELTFVAPLSGRVMLWMPTRIDADSPAEEAAWDVEVRQDDESGSVVHSPNVGDGFGGQMYFNPDFPQSTNYIGMRLLSGLIAAGTYWAQLQWNTDGTNMDIGAQNIVAQPLT